LLDLLKDDSRAIITAACEAQAAADQMHGQQPIDVSPG
jgi:antirestriction protein ArdC